MGIGAAAGVFDRRFLPDRRFSCAGGEQTNAERDDPADPRSLHGSSL
jgi:hypothetical protein